jgi:cytochrome c oxidase assembly factor CtaG
MSVASEERLSGHMVQHLLLTLVAAPLLVLGEAPALALQASRGPLHRTLVGVARGRTMRTLLHPLIAWTALAATTVAAHLTGWYDAALRDPALHGLEHAAFLAAALLFWAPVIGSNPLRAVRSWAGRTLYLLLAMIPMSAVAVLLVAAPGVRYPTYARAAHAAGVDAVRDQRLGGHLMWVGGSVWMVAACVVLGWQALVREERRQQALEAIDARRHVTEARS